MIDLVPASEEEAAAIIRAHAEKRRALAISGGDTRSGFGNAVEAEDRLRSSGLSGIVAYNPGEMVGPCRKRPDARLRAHGSSRPHGHIG
jgi:glycolate oxidase FAD binding subunit